MENKFAITAWVSILSLFTLWQIINLFRGNYRDVWTSVYTVLIGLSVVGVLFLLKQNK